MQSSQVRNVGLELIPSTSGLSNDTPRELPLWMRDPKKFPLDWLSINRSNIVRCTKEYTSELVRWRKCQKLSTASRLKGVLKRIMMFLHTHMSYVDGKNLIDCELEEDLVTLVSIYIDMELKVWLKKREEVIGSGEDMVAQWEHRITDRIAHWMYTMLGAHTQRVDTLLSLQTLYVRHAKPVLDPIFRKVLWEITDSSLTDVSYVRYMLAYKMWHERVLVAEDDASRALTEHLVHHLVPMSNYARFSPALRGCLSKTPRNVDNVARFHMMPNNVNLRKACDDFLKHCRVPIDEINFGSISLIEDDFEELLGDEEAEVKALMKMIAERHTQKKASGSVSSPPALSRDANTAPIISFVDLTDPEPPRQPQQASTSSSSPAHPEPSSSSSSSSVAAVIDLTSDDDEKPSAQPSTSPKKAMVGHHADPAATKSPLMEACCGRSFRGGEEEDVYMHPNLVNFIFMCPLRRREYGRSKLEIRHMCQETKARCGCMKPPPEDKVHAAKRSSSFEDMSSCFQFAKSEEFAYLNEDEVDDEADQQGVLIQQQQQALTIKRESSVPAAAAAGAAATTMCNNTRAVPEVIDCDDESDFCDNLFAGSLTVCDKSNARTYPKPSGSDVHTKQLDRLQSHPPAPTPETSPALFGAKSPPDASANILGTYSRRLSEKLDKRKGQQAGGKGGNACRREIKFGGQCDDGKTLNCHTREEIRRIKLPVLEADLRVQTEAAAEQVRSEQTPAVLERRAMPAAEPDVSPETGQIPAEIEDRLLPEASGGGAPCVATETRTSRSPEIDLSERTRDVLSRLPLPLETDHAVAESSGGSSSSRRCGEATALTPATTDSVKTQSEMPREPDTLPAEERLFEAEASIEDACREVEETFNAVAAAEDGVVSEIVTEEPTDIMLPGRTIVDEQSVVFAADETIVDEQSGVFAANDTIIDEQSEVFAADETIVDEQSEVFAADETIVDEQSGVFAADETENVSAEVVDETMIISSTETCEVVPEAVPEICVETEVVSNYEIIPEHSIAPDELAVAAEQIVECEIPEFVPVVETEIIGETMDLSEEQTGIEHSTEQPETLPNIDLLPETTELPVPPTTVAAEIPEYQPETIAEEVATTPRDTESMVSSEITISSVEIAATAEETRDSACTETVAGVVSLGSTNSVEELTFPAEIVTDRLVSPTERQTVETQEIQPEETIQTGLESSVAEEMFSCDLIVEETVVTSSYVPEPADIVHEAALQTEVIFPEECTEIENFTGEGQVAERIVPEYTAVAERGTVETMVVDVQRATEISVPVETTLPESDPGVELKTSAKEEVADCAEKHTAEGVHSSTAKRRRKSPLSRIRNDFSEISESTVDDCHSQTEDTWTKNEEILASATNRRRRTSPGPSIDIQLPLDTAVAAKSEDAVLPSPSRRGRPRKTPVPDSQHEESSRADETSIDFVGRLRSRRKTEPAVTTFEPIVEMPLNEPSVNTEQTTENVFAIRRRKPAPASVKRAYENAEKLRRLAENGVSETSHSETQPEEHITTSNSTDNLPANNREDSEQCAEVRSGLKHPKHRRKQTFKGSVRIDTDCKSQLRRVTKKVDIESKRRLVISLQNLSEKEITDLLVPVVKPSSFSEKTSTRIPPDGKLVSKSSKVRRKQKSIEDAPETGSPIPDDVAKCEKPAEIVGKPAEDITSGKGTLEEELLRMERLLRATGSSGADKKVQRKRGRKPGLKKRDRLSPSSTVFESTIRESSTSNVESDQKTPIVDSTTVNEINLTAETDQQIVTPNVNDQKLSPSVQNAETVDPNEIKPPEGDQTALATDAKAGDLELKDQVPNEKDLKDDPCQTNQGNVARKEQITDKSAEPQPVLQPAGKVHTSPVITHLQLDETSQDKFMSEDDLPLTYRRVNARGKDEDVKKTRAPAPGSKTEKTAKDSVKDEDEIDLQTRRLSLSKSRKNSTLDNNRNTMESTRREKSEINAKNRSKSTSDNRNAESVKLRNSRENSKPLDSKKIESSMSVTDLAFDTVSRSELELTTRVRKVSRDGMEEKAISTVTKHATTGTHDAADSSGQREHKSAIQSKTVSPDISRRKKNKSQNPKRDSLTKTHTTIDSKSSRDSKDNAEKSASVKSNKKSSVHSTETTKSRQKGSKSAETQGEAVKNTKLQLDTETTSSRAVDSTKPDVGTPETTNKLAPGTPASTPETPKALAEGARRRKLKKPVHAQDLKSRDTSLLVTEFPDERTPDQVPQNKVKPIIATPPSSKANRKGSRSSSRASTAEQVEESVKEEKRTLRTSLFSKMSEPSNDEQKSEEIESKSEEPPFKLKPFKIESKMQYSARALKVRKKLSMYAADFSKKHKSSVVSSDLATEDTTAVVQATVAEKSITTEESGVAAVLEKPPASASPKAAKRKRNRLANILNPKKSKLSIEDDEKVVVKKPRGRPPKFQSEKPVKAAAKDTKVPVDFRPDTTQTDQSTLAEINEICQEIQIEIVAESASEYAQVSSQFKPSEAVIVEKSLEPSVEIHVNESVPNLRLNGLQVTATVDGNVDHAGTACQVGDHSSKQRRKSVTKSDEYKGSDSDSESNSELVIDTSAETSDEEEQSRAAPSKRHWKKEKMYAMKNALIMEKTRDVNVQKSVDVGGVGNTHVTSNSDTGVEAASAADVKVEPCDVPFEQELPVAEVLVQNSSVETNDKVDAIIENKTDVLIENTTIIAPEEPCLVNTDNDTLVIEDSAISGPEKIAASIPAVVSEEPVTAENNAVEVVSEEVVIEDLPSTPVDVSPSAEITSNNVESKHDDEITPQTEDSTEPEEVIVSVSEPPRTTEEASGEIQPVTVEVNQPVTEEVNQPVSEEVCAEIQPVTENTDSDTTFEQVVVDETIMYEDEQLQVSEIANTQPLCTDVLAVSTEIVADICVPEARESDVSASVTVAGTEKPNTEIIEEQTPLSAVEECVVEDQPVIIEEDNNPNENQTENVSVLQQTDKEAQSDEQMKEINAAEEPVHLEQTEAEIVVNQSSGNIEPEQTELEQPQQTETPVFAPDAIEPSQDVEMSVVQEQEPATTVPVKELVLSVAQEHSCFFDEAEYTETDFSANVSAETAAVTREPLIERYSLEITTVDLQDTEVIIANIAEIVTGTSTSHQALSQHKVEQNIRTDFSVERILAPPLPPIRQAVETEELVVEEFCTTLEITPPSVEKVLEIVQPHRPLSPVTLAVSLVLEDCTLNTRTPDDLEEIAKMSTAKCSVNGYQRSQKPVMIRQEGFCSYFDGFKLTADALALPETAMVQAVASTAANECTLTAEAASATVKIGPLPKPVSNYSAGEIPADDNYNLNILASMAFNLDHLDTKTENNNVLGIAGHQHCEDFSLRPDDMCVFLMFPDKQTGATDKDGGGGSDEGDVDTDKLSAHIQRLSPKGLTLESKIQHLTELANKKQPNPSRAGSGTGGENFNDLLTSLEDMLVVDNAKSALPMQEPEIPMIIPNTAHLHLIPDDDDFLMSTTKKSLGDDFLKKSPADEYLKKPPDRFAVNLSLDPASGDLKIEPYTLEPTKDFISEIANLDLLKVDKKTDDKKRSGKEAKIEPKSTKSKAKTNNKSPSKGNSEASFLLSKYKNSYDKQSETSAQQGAASSKTVVSPPSYIRSTRPMRMVTTRKRKNAGPDGQEAQDKKSSTEEMFDKLLEEHKKETQALSTTTDTVANTVASSDCSKLQQQQVDTESNRLQLSPGVASMPVVSSAADTRSTVNSVSTAATATRLGGLSFSFNVARLLGKLAGDSTAASKAVSASTTIASVTARTSSTSPAGPLPNISTTSVSTASPLSNISTTSASTASPSPNISTTSVTAASPLPSISTSVSNISPLPNISTSVSNSSPLPNISTSVSNISPLPNISTSVSNISPLPNISTGVSKISPLPNISTGVSKISPLPNISTTTGPTASPLPNISTTSVATCSPLPHISTTSVPTTSTMPDISTTSVPTTSTMPHITTTSAAPKPTATVASPVTSSVSSPKTASSAPSASKTPPLSPAIARSNSTSSRSSGGKLNILENIAVHMPVPLHDRTKGTKLNICDTLKFIKLPATREEVQASPRQTPPSPAREDHQAKPPPAKARSGAAASETLPSIPVPVLEYTAPKSAKPGKRIRTIETVIEIKRVFRSPDEEQQVPRSDPEPKDKDSRKHEKHKAKSSQKDATEKPEPRASATEKPEPQVALVEDAPVIEEVVICGEETIIGEDSSSSVKEDPLLIDETVKSQAVEVVTDWFKRGDAKVSSEPYAEVTIEECQFFEEASNSSVTSHTVTGARKVVDDKVYNKEYQTPDSGIAFDEDSVQKDRLDTSILGDTDVYRAQTSPGIVMEPGVKNEPETADVARDKSELLLNVDMKPTTETSVVAKQTEAVAPIVSEKHASAKTGVADVKPEVIPSVVDEPEALVVGCVEQVLPASGIGAAEVQLAGTVNSEPETSVASVKPGAEPVFKKPSVMVSIPLSRIKHSIASILLGKPGFEAVAGECSKTLDKLRKRKTEAPVTPAAAEKPEEPDTIKVTDKLRKRKPEATVVAQEKDEVETGKMSDKLRKPKTETTVMPVAEKVEESETNKISDKLRRRKPDIVQVVQEIEERESNKMIDKLRKRKTEPVEPEPVRIADKLRKRKHEPIVVEEAKKRRNTPVKELLAETPADSSKSKKTLAEKPVVVVDKESDKKKSSVGAAAKKDVLGVDKESDKKKANVGAATKKEAVVVDKESDKKKASVGAAAKKEVVVVDKESDKKKASAVTKKEVVDKDLEKKKSGAASAKKEPLAEPALVEETKREEPKVVQQSAATVSSKDVDRVKKTVEPVVKETAVKDVDKSKIRTQFTSEDLTQDAKDSDKTKKRTQTAIEESQQGAKDSDKTKKRTQTAIEESQQDAKDVEKMKKRAQPTIEETKQDAEDVEKSKKRTQSTCEEPTQASKDSDKTKKRTPTATDETKQDTDKVKKMRVIASDEPGSGETASKGEDKSKKRVRSTVEDTPQDPPAEVKDKRKRQNSSDGVQLPTARPEETVEPARTPEKAKKRTQSTSEDGQGENSDKEPISDVLQNVDWIVKRRPTVADDKPSGRAAEADALKNKRRTATNNQAEESSPVEQPRKRKPSEEKATDEPCAQDVLKNIDWIQKRRPSPVDSGNAEAAAAEKSRNTDGVKKRRTSTALDRPAEHAAAKQKPNAPKLQPEPAETDVLKNIDWIKKRNQSASECPTTVATSTPEKDAAKCADWIKKRRPSAVSEKSEVSEKEAPAATRSVDHGAKKRRQSATDDTQSESGREDAGTKPDDYASELTDKEWSSEEVMSPATSQATPVRSKGSKKEYPDCLFGITESPVPSATCCINSPYPSDISLQEEPTFYVEGGIDLCTDFQDQYYESFDSLKEQQSLQAGGGYGGVVDETRKEQQSLQAGYCVVDSQFTLPEHMNDGDLISMIIENNMIIDKRMVAVNMHQVQPEMKPHSADEPKRGEFDDFEPDNHLSGIVDGICRNLDASETVEFCQIDPSLLTGHEHPEEVQLISVDQASAEVQVVICDALPAVDSGGGGLGTFLFDGTASADVVHQAVYAAVDAVPANSTEPDGQVVVEQPTPTLADELPLCHQEIVIPMSETEPVVPVPVAEEIVPPTEGGPRAAAEFAVPEEAVPAKVPKPVTSFSYIRAKDRKQQEELLRRTTKRGDDDRYVQSNKPEKLVKIRLPGAEPTHVQIIARSPQVTSNADRLFEHLKSQETRREQPGEKSPRAPSPKALSNADRLFDNLKSQKTPTVPLKVYTPRFVSQKQHTVAKVQPEPDLKPAKTPEPKASDVVKPISPRLVPSKPQDGKLFAKAYDPKPGAPKLEAKLPHHVPRRNMDYDFDSLLASGSNPPRPTARTPKDYGRNGLSEPTPKYAFDQRKATAEASAPEAYRKPAADATGHGAPEYYRTRSANKYSPRVPGTSKKFPSARVPAEEAVANVPHRTHRSEPVYHMQRLDSSTYIPEPTPPPAAATATAGGGNPGQPRRSHADEKRWLKNQKLAELVEAANSYYSNKY